MSDDDLSMVQHLERPMMNLVTDLPRIAQLFDVIFVDFNKCF